MFLKVEMTAYFSVNGLKIEKKEFANDPDSNGIYLNGKKISPDIFYFLEKETDGRVELVELPKSMSIELDSSSYKEEFVTRAQIWESDPESKKYDNIMEEISLMEEKEKSNNK